MKDYTKEIVFWKRLESFVSDVQTNCCMGEEEKQMIIHNCKLKILDIQRVSNSVCDCCVPRPEDPFEYDNPICEKCGLPIKQTDC